MAGLLDTLAGSSDPSTADPTTGLVDSQRKQLAYGILGQTGAALLAAGAPQMPGQQAQYLAQLGNIPGNVASQQAQMQQGNLIAQRGQAEQQKVQQQKAMQAYAGSPEFQKELDALPPAMKAVATAQIKGGDIEGVLKTVKESRVQTAPINLGDGNIGFKRPDGSYLVVNSKYGTRTTLGADGTQLGSVYGSGAPVDPTDMDLGPNGTRDAWLAKQDRPPGYADTLRKVSAGDLDLKALSPRDPLRGMIQRDISIFDPNWKEQDYAAKQQVIKAARPGGDTFKRVIGPGSAFLDHSSKAADLTDELVKRGIISDSTMSYLGGNTVALMYSKATSPEDRRLINQWIEQKGKSTDEFNKYMHGTGGLTDQSQREGEALKSATDPATIKGRLAAMTDMMHGQLVPIAQSYHQAMKKPSAQPIDMLGPTAGAALAKLQNWTQGQQTPTLPDNTPITDKAQAQPQAQAAPPIPGAKQAPDGNWYVPDPKRQGKFLMVR